MFASMNVFGVNQSNFSFSQARFSDKGNVSELVVIKPFSSLSEKQKENCEKLMTCIRKGDFDSAKCIIDSDNSVINVDYEYGVTPLTEALLHNHDAAENIRECCV